VITRSDNNSRPDKNDATAPAFAVAPDSALVPGCDALPFESPLFPAADRTAVRIAIIDDEPLNIQVAQKLLQDAGYRRFVTTSNASEALDLLLSDPPDLVLLDIVMPEVSGMEILKCLRATAATRHIPVLILTMVTDGRVKYEAIRLGATDFLTKPVDAHELAARVRNALVSKSYHDRLANEKVRLEQMAKQRTDELAASRREVVHLLARAAEYRDDETGRHVIRVGLHAGVIARGLGFGNDEVELLELAAQLHDLGKLAIPDSILHKPEKLDDKQTELMRTHCGIAKKIMQPLAEEEWRILQTHSRDGAKLMQMHDSPLLKLATRIAQTHHEWWDGTGYPLGLAGEDIPIEGRITAVADVFDALSSARPYKDAYPREKCFAMLEEARGTHFDPKVLDTFFDHKNDVIQIQLQYMDVD
jgi:putative two-component system response regulator